MTNRELFKSTYAKHLEQCIVAYPTDYLWTRDELPDVLGRMFIAIDKMSFDKDSHAFKKTCKTLGIKHTYKAIKTYLEG